MSWWVLICLLWLFTLNSASLLFYRDVCVQLLGIDCTNTSQNTKSRTEQWLLESQYISCRISLSSSSSWPWPSLLTSTPLSNFKASIFAGLVIPSQNIIGGALNSIFDTKFWWPVRSLIIYGRIQTIRKNLVDNAFTLVNDFIFDAIHQTSGYSGSQNGHPEHTHLNNMFDEVKLYWMRKDLPDNVELIYNTVQLALNFGRMQNYSKVTDMIASDENKYFILYM